MARKRRDEFRTDLEIWGARYADYKNQRPVVGEEKDDVLEIYGLAAVVDLPIPIGASESVWLPSVIHNFGGLSVTPYDHVLNGGRYVSATSSTLPEEIVARRQLKDLYSTDPAHLQQGTVLLERAWSLAKNDAFIQGAIDGEKEMHLASSARSIDRISPDEIYDARYKRPTVLGRELIGLATQDYSVVPHDYAALGVVMIPRVRGARPRVTLKDRLDILNGIRDDKDVMQIINALSKSSNTLF